MRDIAAHTLPTLSSGLDYYKFTMSQLQYRQVPQAEVTFALHNRSAVRLSEYVDPAALQAALQQLARQGFVADEIAYLRQLRRSDGQPVFAADYCDMLAQAQLPAVQVSMRDGDIHVETRGAWPLVTFWETVVMALVNELYFAGYMRAQRVASQQISDEGQQRLEQTIRLLLMHPEIKFVDFGTRRRFSWMWHQTVLTTLQQAVPQQLVGTSNVALAAALGLRPIGTFAHEMPMVYAALADKAGRDVRLSHQQFLQDWYAMYGVDLAIALTDTFGSRFFFDTWTREQAQQWRGVRHDSGDPFAFGERVIAWYSQHGIDPRTKSLVFSDSLTRDMLVRLYDRFGQRIGVLFGWGTHLTNDVGLRPLNIVMKAVAVDGVPTVKLSDDVGKHMGSAEKIAQYQEVFV